jgi:hypothetical protein
VQFHTFLTSSASHPGLFTLGQLPPGPNRQEAGWVPKSVRELLVTLTSLTHRTYHRTAAVVKRLLKFRDLGYVMYTCVGEVAATQTKNQTLNSCRSVGLYRSQMNWNNSVQSRKLSTVYCIEAAWSGFILSSSSEGLDCVHLVRRSLFGPLYQPQMTDNDECEAVLGMIISRRNQNTRRAKKVSDQSERRLLTLAACNKTSGWRNSGPHWLDVCRIFWSAVSFLIHIHSCVHITMGMKSRTWPVTCVASLDAEGEVMTPHNIFRR